MRAFCREYVKDFNGTRAAIAAGFKEKAAYSQASRMLKNVKVQEFIARLSEGKAKKAKLNADDVLLELKKLALADLRVLFDEKGKLKDTKDWPDDISMAVSSVKIKESIHPVTRKVTGHTKELKLWDKTKALELIGRHLKLYTDKVEQSGSVDHTVAVVDIEQMKALRAKFDSSY